MESEFIEDLEDDDDDDDLDEDAEKSGACRQLKHRDCEDDLCACWCHEVDEV